MNVSLIVVHCHNFFFQGKESTHLGTNTGPMVACINCSESFAMSAISDHHLDCNAGGSGTARKEKRYVFFIHVRKIFKIGQVNFLKKFFYNLSS